MKNVFPGVWEAWSQSQFRIEERRKLLPASEKERVSMLKPLRRKMFLRQEGGSAFNPLDDKELAILEWRIREYLEEERFTIADDGGSQEFYPLLEKLRYDHLNGTRDVTPKEFRTYADAAVFQLLSKLGPKLGFVPVASTCFMTWRGALAFGAPAVQWGCRNFHHLGAARNETTAEAEIYYQHPFVLRPDNIYLSVDPMLATGGTQIKMIEELMGKGVKSENIIVLAIVSAPEGVDRILHRFPHVRVATAAHDERLNSKAYIEPGLGDFGDKYFEGLTEEDADIWRKQGVLDDAAFAALTARMRELAGVTA